MKKNRGLADTQDGEFILNESGTSVSTDLADTQTPQASNEAEDNSNENKGDEKGVDGADKD